MVNDDKLNKMLSAMKPADKAKAFDMIVDAYKNQGSTSLNEAVVNVIDWCSMWFTN